jgi:ABC-2 type transport system ATP-binding protein
MLQEGGVYPGVKPLEALRLFASYYDNPEDPELLLDAVGLREAQNTLVRRLSGGQRQRLSLALSLVGRPELVFLDEPTAGMDPRARATTWQLIRNLRQRGVTVVLTTHAMDEAEHLCDRLAIVDHGHIVGAGTPIELTALGSEEELRFAARPGLDLPELAAAMRVVVTAVHEPRPGDYVVTARATAERIADLAAWLRDQGAVMEELSTGRRSLEDVFLRLTSEGRA